MTNLPKASFWHRLVASLLDTMLFLAISALFLYAASIQPTLPQAVFILFLWLILIVLNPLVYVFGILMTHYFGGTLGKIFTGLRVTNEHGKPLTLRRIAFRQTLGYQFSALIFGLGYFAILKDPNRQAWHDKTVGSVVVTERPTWLVGLMLLLGLTIATFFIVTSAVTAATTGPLRDEAQTLFMQSMMRLEKENAEEESGPYNIDFITPSPSEYQYETY